MAPLDDALEALADYRRRELLFAVRETRGRIETVSVPEDVVSEALGDRVVHEYHHVHLPMLEDYGYVHWDRRRDEIAEGPQFDQLRPLLDGIEGYHDEREPMTA